MCVDAPCKSFFCARILFSKQVTAILGKSYTIQFIKNETMVKRSTNIKNII